jgi:hypothetical protein
MRLSSGGFFDISELNTGSSRAARVAILTRLPD